MGASHDPISKAGSAKAGSSSVQDA